MEQSNKCFFCAYAKSRKFRSGENISNVADKDSVYYKNAAVALYSAKIQHPECDVALVTNEAVPEPYLSFFDANGIKIYLVPFNEFVFDASAAWGLAFYKLCALKWMMCKDYDYYILMDTDVYVQSRMDDLFKEMDYHILMHDRHPRLSNPTQMKKTEEYRIYGENEFLTEWGGEFIAGTKAYLTSFVASCERVYYEMRRRGFQTDFGDEFIISIAAKEHLQKIKNADGYVGRYWTGTFRLVSTNYKFDSVSVLHMPAEKTDGMIKMYKYIMRHNQIPSNNHAYRILHLRRPSSVTIIKAILKKILAIN